MYKHNPAQQPCSSVISGRDGFSKITTSFLVRQPDNTDHTNPSASLSAHREAELLVNTSKPSWKVAPVSWENDHVIVGEVNVAKQRVWASWTHDTDTVKRKWYTQIVNDQMGFLPFLTSLHKSNLPFAIYILVKWRNWVFWQKQNSNQCMNIRSFTVFKISNNMKCTYMEGGRQINKKKKARVWNIVQWEGKRSPRAEHWKPSSLSICHLSVFWLLQILWVPSLLLEHLTLFSFLFNLTWFLFHWIFFLF